MLTNKGQNDIISIVSDGLIRAGSTFREDKKQAYRQAIENETNERARKSPLCLQA